MIEEFRNPDDTYNGIKFLAAISGLTEAEVAWMGARFKQLIVVEGMDKVAARQIVKNEAVAKQWLNTTGPA